MGESAGAFEVGNLVNTNPNAPPFRAAVEMSGNGIVDPRALLGANPQISEWDALMTLLNCTNAQDPQDELACARAADAQTIMSLLEANQLLFANALPDNTTALTRPDLAWTSRNVAPVPLLIGSTLNDGSIFVPGLPDRSVPVPTREGFATLLGESLGLDDTTSAMFTAYYGPGGPYANGATDYLESYSAIITDLAARCPARLVANLTSTLMEQPTYQYIFNATTPSTTWPQYPGLGVYHASDVALVFGTFRRDENTTQAEIEFSRSFQKQFADFVKDPVRGPGWARWPVAGLLGNDDMGAVTREVDSVVFDEVCQYYDPIYLAGLPALAQMDLEGLWAANGSEGGSRDDDGDGEGESADEGTENAGVKSGVWADGFGVVAAGLLGMVFLA
jgi:carboxylesterase type B